MNEYVKSGQWVCAEGRSQLQRLREQGQSAVEEQIKQHTDDLRNGDDPQAKKQAIVVKVREMRDLSDRIS